jgi:type IV secretion system protein VirB5
MNSNRSISIISFVLWKSFSNHVVAGGIPVIDAASIADRQAQHLETILKWKTQYDQMTSQINQLKAEYDSMTGSRGLGQIMNNEELKNYLPSDWQEVYDAVKEGGYEGLTGTAKDVYESNRVFDACASLTIEDQRLACEARAVKPAQDKGFALDAYEKAKDRLNQIDQLMTQIDATTDPKEIAELQGRIASEQAMIANEQTKLQLYAMVARAEDRVQQQRRREINAKANARRGWVQPEPIEW